MADIEKLDLSMAGERCDDAVLPCPFCGSKNIAYGKYEHTAGRRYAIVCMNCMAQIDPGWARSWGAVQEMWNHRAQPVNEPLTLEQLRGMDNEPVWIEHITMQKYSHWYIWSNAPVDDTHDGFDGYGKTWLAYRRKPEEEHHEAN